MDERQTGNASVPANLLMPSKRHLPGREADEEYSAGSEETFDMFQKAAFSGDVLYDIVNQYDVERFFQLCDLKDIRGNESGGQPFFLKKLAGLSDTVFR